MDRLAVDKVFAELRRVGGDPAALPVPSQTFVIVYSTQGVIDNGGFRYFFESDWPNNPPYTLFIDAYRRIGAEAAAECFEKAIAMFPFPNAHLKSEWRKEFMGQLPEDHEFFELGFTVCGDKAILEALAEYARANGLLNNDA
jgi:hypothetical protein